MNVARGRNVFSLLQKGFGARGGAVSTSDFWGGFHVPTQREEQSPLALSSQPDFTRRFMATRSRRGRMVKRTGSRHTASTPSMDIAREMPLSPTEMNNSDLVMLGSMGNADARKEILIRHIMTVDNVGYMTAYNTFDEIAAKNREGMWLLTLPYKAGIAVAVTLALGSFPLCFDLNTVSWFNELYVTADIPEPKDLETALEVGSWAWNWMEPPLGQMSFFLLCMQYTRAQISNIGIRPYTETVRITRAHKLAAAFPQYDSRVIISFSETVSFYDDKHGLRGK